VSCFYLFVQRLLSRILHNVAGVYPINSRFVNTSEWEDPGVYGSRIPNILLTYFPAFETDHNAQWGRFYEDKDVVVEWHGASIQSYAFLGRSLMSLSP
jgi:proteasome activator subunit 4